MITSIIKRSTQEHLEILPCPFCNGEIKVSDCGYTTFNPGQAKCDKCNKKWKMGYVKNQWEVGLKWNKAQPFLKEINDLQERLDILKSKAGLDR